MVNSFSRVNIPTLSETEENRNNSVNLNPINPSVSTIDPTSTAAFIEALNSAAEIGEIITNLPISGSININANEAYEQILRSFRNVKNFNALIINKTNEDLIRVGSYNEVAIWPLSDIEAMTARKEDFEGGLGRDAAIAANYKIGNRYFQFAISFPYLQVVPLIEQVAIGLENQQRGGNTPAKDLFKNTHTPDDKHRTASPYKARALMTQQGHGDDNKIIWIFEVSYA